MVIKLVNTGSRQGDVKETETANTLDTTFGGQAVASTLLAPVQGGQRDMIPMVIAHGQANAETVSDGSPSLTDNHEAPILVFDAAQITSKQHGSQPSEISQPLNTLAGMSVFEPAISWKESAGGGQGGKGFHGKKEQSFALGGYVPRVGIRRLTPLECERLQGFPDGWTADQSDSARYRQLGNAVTVNVAEWLGRRIMKGLEV